MEKTKQYEFYRVDEIMHILDVKETKAYEIIRQLNSELEQQGKLTVNGRVSRKYFEERIY